MGKRKKNEYNKIWQRGGTNESQGKFIASKLNKNLCQNSMHAKLLCNGDKWDGSPGGVRYRGSYGANNIW